MKNLICAVFGHDWWYRERAYFMTKTGKRVYRKEHYWCLRCNQNKEA